MKYKKLMAFGLSIFTILSLSGCSWNWLVGDLVSDYNSQFEEEPNPTFGFRDDVTNNSLDILNEAFNGEYNLNNEPLMQEFNEEDFTYETTNGGRIVTIDKNVTDLELNDNLTPSIGNINGLVIPIDFSDFPADDLKTVSDPRVSYQSVHSYYYNSSFGKLNMHFDIAPWFRAPQSSKYYEAYKEDIKNGFIGEVPGVSLLIHQALNEAAKVYDLSKYDNDKDGFIDSLHIIYSRPVDYTGNSETWWAFQYANFNDYQYDGLFQEFYVWAGYDFLYDREQINNARTFIHETGHQLGLLDYYDYDFSRGFNKGGLGGFDMMDGTAGDHNAYSKMALGWIDKVLLIEMKDLANVKLNLKPSNSSGNVIMICDNFNDDLGMFQSYFLMELFNEYTPLNENEYERISKCGIRVYRVNQQLVEVRENNEVYHTYKYDNSYTPLNLIDAIIAPNSSIYSRLVYNKGNIAKDSDLFTRSYKENPLYYVTESGSVRSKYSFKVNAVNGMSAQLEFYNSENY